MVFMTAVAIKVMVAVVIIITQKIICGGFGNLVSYKVLYQKSAVREDS